MTSVDEIKIIVKAEVAGALKNLKNVQSSSEKTSLGFKTLLSSGLAVAGIAKAVSLVTNAIKNAIKTQIDFEQAIANVASVSGDSRSELAELARQMGKSTVFSATESANALYFMASAGLAVNDMAKVIKPTLDLAAAAQMGIAEATDIVVNNLKVFQTEGIEAAEIVDYMAQTVRSSNTNMQQLGEALKISGSEASLAGIKFKDLNVLIAGMANIGQKGSEAGTKLRMVFARLSSGMKEVSGTLSKYGITQKEVNDLLPTPIKLFEKLNEANITNSDATKIFGVRNKAVFKLIRDGIPDLQNLQKTMRSAGGAASNMASIQLDTLAGAIKLLNSQWQELILSFSNNAFLKDMVQLITKMVGLVNFWKNDSIKFRVVTEDLVAINREYTGVLKKLKNAGKDVNENEREMLKNRKQILEIQMVEAIEALNFRLKDQVGLFNKTSRQVEKLYNNYNKLIDQAKGLAKYGNIQQMQKANKIREKAAKILNMINGLEGAHAQRLKNLALVFTDLNTTNETRKRLWGAMSVKVREALLREMKILKKTGKLGADGIRKRIKARKKLNKNIRINVDVQANALDEQKANVDDYYNYILDADDKQIFRLQENAEKAIDGAKLIYTNGSIELTNEVKRIKVKMHKDIQKVEDAALAKSLKKQNDARKKAMEQTKQSIKSILSLANTIGSTIGGEFGEAISGVANFGQAILDNISNPVGLAVAVVVAAIGAIANEMQKAQLALNKMTEMSMKHMEEVTLEIAQRQVTALELLKTNALTAFDEITQNMLDNFVLRGQATENYNAFLRQKEAERYADMSDEEKREYDLKKSADEEQAKLEAEKLELEKQREKERLALVAKHDAEIKKAKMKQFEIEKSIEQAKIKIDKAKAISEVHKNFPMPWDIGTRRGLLSNINTLYGDIESLINSQVPSFRSGIENFSGGVAKVHGGEVLANLAPGTSVIPANRVSNFMNQNQSKNITIENLNLPNVQDTRSLLLELDEVANSMGSSVLSEKRI